MPEYGEGVAVLFGLADHRLVPGGIDSRLHSRRIEPADLLQPQRQAGVSSRAIERSDSMWRPVRASIRSLNSSRLRSAIFVSRRRGINASLRRSASVHRRASRDWSPHYRETTANFIGVKRFPAQIRL